MSYLANQPFNVLAFDEQLVEQAVEVTLSLSSRNVNGDNRMSES